MTEAEKTDTEPHGSAMPSHPSRTIIIVIEDVCHDTRHHSGVS